MATKFLRMYVYTYVFEIEQHDCTCANTVICQGRWFVKYGGQYSEVDIYHTFSTNPDVDEFSD